MAKSVVPIELALQHEKLLTEIDDHDIAYHQNDSPTVSDADYDELRRKLLVLETAYPDLETAASPSRKVGAATAGKFAKVKHVVPMLSLSN